VQLVPCRVSDLLHARGGRPMGAPLVK